MKNIEKNIIREARKYNACELLRDGMTPGDLANLGFTPQGQEFCAKCTFPSLKQIEALGASVDPENVNICFAVNRRAYITPNKTRKFVVAGPECDVEIVCAENDETYTILVYHGANVTIHAGGYAVVKVVEIGEGCKVNFLNYEKAVRL